MKDKLVIVAILFLLAVTLTSCDSYDQEVIAPAVVVEDIGEDKEDAPVEEITPEETTPEETTPEETTPEETTPEETTPEEETKPENKYEGLTPEEEQVQRERDALSLIDLSTVNIDNCDDLGDKWRLEIQKVQDEIDDAEEDLEEEEEDFGFAQQRYDNMTSTGTEAQIDAAKNDLEEAEDELDDVEDLLEDLDEKLFRTDYTQEQIDRICKQLKAAG